MILFQVNAVDIKKSSSSFSTTIESRSKLWSQYVSIMSVFTIEISGTTIFQMLSVFHGAYRETYHKPNPITLKQLKKGNTFCLKSKYHLLETQFSLTLFEVKINSCEVYILNLFKNIRTYALYTRLSLLLLFRWVAIFSKKYHQ